jgi:signal transduction histidine kinase
VFGGVMTLLFRGKHRAEKRLKAQQGTIEAQNEALLQQNQALQELSNEKNEFLGIAVHDLKNPLTAIRLITQAVQTEQQSSTQNSLQNSLQNTSHKIERYAATMHDMTGQMLNIVTNLLDVSRLESGGWQPNPMKISAAIVYAVADNYRERSAAKGMRIDVAIDFPDNSVETAEADTPPSIWADYDGVYHVLDNLYSNAVKYSPLGTTIAVRVSTHADRVRMSVQDHGPGLSDEDKGKLFGKFARLSARPTGGEHSTGLGLSIVKKMVELMQGRVWCESELGKGATFIVELPVA